MTLPMVPLAIAVLTAIAYALPIPPSPRELARLTYLAAVLVVLASLASPHVALLTR